MWQVYARILPAGQMQRFVSVLDQVANLFHRCRYNVSTTEKRTNRSRASATWEGVTCANTFGIQTA